MNNDYQDYQLEDMEDNAINKSNNFKKAAVIGGAVLGVGATAAYAASKMNPGDTDLTAETDSELTSEDLMDGANAGAIDSEVIDETVTTTAPEATEEVHIHHHHYDNPAPAPEVEADPEVSIDETGIIYDEEGNVVSVFDRGTIDGKNFTVMDTDGNGYADKIGYDVNGNGIYEADEIADMDNRSYQMGQGQTLGQYVQDSEGNLYAIQDPMPRYDGQLTDDGTAQLEPDEKIHNDFIDEKNDGQFDDVARNNPDYNNNYDHDYGAAPEEPHAGLAYVDEVTEDDTIVNDNLAYADVTPSLHEEIDAPADFEVEDNYDGLAYDYDEPSYEEPSYDATDDLASNDYSDDASFTDTVDFV